MSKTRKHTPKVVIQTNATLDTTTPILTPIDGVDFDPLWEFPTPREGEFIKKSQKDFYNEYMPTGHKIFCRNAFPDIFYEKRRRVADENGKFSYKTELHRREVRRIAFPFQKQAVDIFMAHYLGNPVKFDEISFGKNTHDDLMTLFKDVWKVKGMESITYKALSHSYTVAQSAVYFYRYKKQVKVKVFSYIEGDQIAVKKDAYGNVTTLLRKYKHKDSEGKEAILIDVIDDKTVVTYNEDGTVKSSVNHAFGVAPFVYFYNPNGSLWQFAQTQIEDVEIDFSKLADDNHSKTKPKYYMNAEKPSGVKVENVGTADVIVGGVNDDLKLIAGADLSPAFEFVYENLVEQIQNTLGIVFPKHKSSGDMPTGSMKMMFYPTERVVMREIHQFSEAINQLGYVFKKCVESEVRLEFGQDLSILKTHAVIDLFTPQDKSAKLKNAIDAHKAGLLSLKQATNEIAAIGIGSNSNYEELIVEQEEQERKELEAEARKHRQNKEVRGIGKQQEIPFGD